MKIVHILPPLTKGGAEKVAVDLANHAARSGHEVTIVAAYPERPERHVFDPRLTVRYVADSPSRYRKFLALGPWLFRNRRWLLSRDVVHCHLTFGAVAGTMIQFMRRLGRRQRPVVIETYHAVGMPIPPAKRALAALLAPGRDGFALMADDEYWTRFRQHRPKLPVRIIPNGVALPPMPRSAEDIAAYRRKVGIPADALVVGTVGRIVGARMPLRMIDVFAEIARNKGQSIHFFMGGSGEMKEDSRRYADVLGIADRMHFPGLVEDPFLAFGTMDLYVSINVGAITGIAGLEAAGSGLAVIALQTRPDHDGGTEDWIWSNPDPGEVAAEALRLLNDAAARRELAKRQATRVRGEYSDAAMAAAYEAFYGECLAR